MKTQAAAEVLAALFNEHKSTPPQYPSPPRNCAGPVSDATFMILIDGAQFTITVTK